MNFAAALLAGPVPDTKTALLTRQGEVSYGQLRRRAARVAMYLVARGLRPGERVLLAGESSAFWAECYLGIALAGGVSVPVAVPVAMDQLAALVASTTPRFGCVQSRWLPRLAAGLTDLALVLTEACPSRATAGIELAVTAELTDGGPVPTPSTAADDLAVINFTSGTSGTPRGVMVSHGNILANAADIIASLGITSDERIMAVLPFHYCFGASLLHTHLLAGASLVIDNRFLFPDKVLQNMIDTECTTLAGVPSTYQILLRRSSLAKMKFPHLRKLQQAGGHLAAAVVAELEAALPGAELYIMYGQTEATARLSCLTADERREHPGSVGRGLDHSFLQVVDAEGQPVAPGAVGEIVATGPHIALGYWQAPAATARTFAGGLHTGDLATRDADGYVTIVGRSREFLKCGGKRISCRSVEEQVLAFAGVVEAVVVGVPDEILGEAVCLFVVHTEGEAAAPDLHRHCARELPLVAVPVRTVFLPELPRNRSGKPDKVALRHLAEPRQKEGQL